jgi:hypothetical protein
MNSNDLSFISDFVKLAEECYDFATIIWHDFGNYNSERRQDKIKKKIEKLRDLIGSIDSMFSKLKIDLEIWHENSDPQEYEKHIHEFKTVFRKTQDVTNPILSIAESSYFNNFPELRDSIFMKVGMETTSEFTYYTGIDPEEDLGWKDYPTFKGFVDNIQNKTRKALNDLNNHLKSEFH